MQLPLEGVKVLDLSHALAGPHCSTMLADFGAEVFKLETPVTGDIARAWGVPLDGGENSYFIALHRNKRGLSINLKSERGRELFMDLIEQVDVVLENFRVGTLDKLGLGYEVARTRNPGIIYTSISGFGLDGPYRDRAAMDLIIQGESGMISVTGEPDSAGSRCGVSIADLTAGMYAAFGTLMALRVKEKTGQGQRVDVSMLEGQMSLLSVMISSYLASGNVPKPMGTAYGPLLPYQAFPTQTESFTIAIGSEKLWKVFCPLIGRPDLTNDSRFKTNYERTQNRAQLIDILTQVFLTKTFAEWAELFEANGIPFGALNSVDKLLEHPQVKARESMVSIDHPRAGPYQLVGVPVRLSETPGAIRSPSPALGEHTSATLRDLLGMSDTEVEELLAADVAFGQ